MARRRRLPDVPDAREALETKPPRAAGRRTDSDLAAIDAALSHMASVIVSGGSGEEGDRRFTRR